MQTQPQPCLFDSHTKSWMNICNTVMISSSVCMYFLVCVFVCSVWGGVFTLVSWGGSLPRGPPPPPPQVCPLSSPGLSEGTAAPASNPTMKHSPAGTRAVAQHALHLFYPQPTSFCSCCTPPTFTLLFSSCIISMFEVRAPGSCFSFNWGCIQCRIVPVLQTPPMDTTAWHISLNIPKTAVCVIAQQFGEGCVCAEGARMEICPAGKRINLNN